MEHAPTPSGISNAKLAVWLFLSSEVMLFVALFSAYVVLRTGATTWPWGWDVLNVPLATANTVILITSSITIVMAYTRAYDKDVRGFRAWMAVTVALSVLFLCLKGVEYTQDFHEGVRPATNLFYTMYFTMTGLHGLHILAGVLVNSGLLYMSFVPEHWENPLFLGRVEGAGLYWHFVDMVWLFLFPTLYLL